MKIEKLLDSNNLFKDFEESYQELHEKLEQSRNKDNDTRLNVNSSVSKICLRKSIGNNASVKPVKVLRQIFSPSTLKQKGKSKKFFNNYFSKNIILRNNFYYFQTMICKLSSVPEIKMNRYQKYLYIKC